MTKGQEERQEEILQAFQEAGRLTEDFEGNGFSAGSELSDWSDVKGSLDEEGSEAEEVDGIEEAAGAACWSTLSLSNFWHCSSPCTCKALPKAEESEASETE